MTFWVDFHTHILDSPSLATDAQQARLSHVSQWLVNSVDLENHSTHVQRAKSHPEALLGVGWHPQQVMEVSPDTIPSTLQKIKKLVPTASYLGETGLDFLYGKTVEQRSSQQKVFAQFIDWSIEHNKLIQVHTRHAKQEALEMLRDKKAENVLLHWFSGNPAQQKEIISQKWVCTVGPTILNSSHMDSFIKNQPVELLGLETDSPIPFGGKPSDPSWIPLVARRVAEIKGVPLLEVQHAQQALFFRFFPTVAIKNPSEKK